MTTPEVPAEVGRERKRQNARWGEQNHAPAAGLMALAEGRWARPTKPSSSPCFRVSASGRHSADPGPRPTTVPG